jgi:hypothetical protein
MNWEVFGRKRFQPYLKYYPGIWLELLRKSMTPGIRNKIHDFYKIVQFLCIVFAPPLNILLSPYSLLDSLKPLNFCTIKTVLTLILLMWRIW